MTWPACFDGPTSAGIDLTSHLVVIDLSALSASPALGLLMTCVTAWLQAALPHDDGVRRLVVVDEAWAILCNQAILFSEGSIRLSAAPPALWDGPCSAGRLRRYVDASPEAA